MFLVVGVDVVCFILLFVILEVDICEGMVCFEKVVVKVVNS